MGAISQIDDRLRFLDINHLIGPEETLPLGEIRRRVERTLAWYGIRSVRAGRFESQPDGTLLLELIDRDGRLLDRAAVDRSTGFVRPHFGTLSQSMSRGPGSGLTKRTEASSQGYE